jgi:rhodanese-related sulfurtransferase
MAQNVIDGTLVTWSPDDLDAALAGGFLILDVRREREFAAGHLPGALHVPHTEVRERIDEIVAAADGRPIRVLCRSGFRSYLAHRVLVAHGLDSASLDGGWLSLLAARPDAPVEQGSRILQEVGS